MLPNIGSQGSPTRNPPPQEDAPITLRLSQAFAAALAAGAVSMAFAQSDPQAPKAVQNPQDHEQGPRVAIEEQQGQALTDQDATQNPQSTPPSAINYANPPKSNKI